MPMPAFEPRAVIDGYRLVRVIGSGGFGDVWLCVSETLQQYLALKIIRPSQGGHDERELAAVQKFKQLALGNTASGIMPIEHVGTANGQVYYIMPLADGNVEKPEDPAWQPFTLGTLIRLRREAPEWFTSGEVINFLASIIRAVETINNAGLVHRDIKPDNILFHQGQPVLSDISLLRDDSELVTEIGTPGYRAPSWYVESGGKPDMFGLAATLYTTLTGNAPDKIGRAPFRWPPQSESSLSESERTEWLRLHRVIFRATAEKPTDRFLTFASMADAMAGSDGTIVKPEPAAPVPKRRNLVPAIALGILLIAAVAGGGTWFLRPKPAATAPSPSVQKADQNSSKEAWKAYDETIAGIQNAFDGYQKKWSQIEAPASAALVNLKQDLPTLESLTMP